MVTSMGGSVRIAVAIGYLGASYSGSQVQPNVPTVQGELEAALIDLKWAKPHSHPVTMSSRTDAGVDARMNIATFILDSQVWSKAQSKGVVTALNDRTPVTIRAWAAEEVGLDFRVRDVESRTYRYRLQAMNAWPEIECEQLDSWCSIFVGKHDFRNFCRPEDGRNTVREVLACESWLDSDGRILGFTIQAKGFVWNQVRRIASAIHRMSTGKATLIEVQDALNNPESSVNLGLAESKWLSLWSIHHPGTPFLTESSTRESMLELNAESTPKGRLYKVWSMKTRLEQDHLHLDTWLAHLNEI